MGRIINKFIVIIIALAGVLGAYSCVQSELQEMPEFITGVNVSIEAPGIFELDEIATKVNYTVSGSSVIASWSGEDDILGIYPIGGEQVAFPMSSSSGTMSAKFDGGAWALRTNYTYAAYFPFSPDYYNISETELPVSYLGQKQNGDNDLSLLGRYSFMTSTASNPDAAGNVNFTLKQVGAWVQLRVVLPEGMNVGKATLIDNTSDLIVGGTLDLNQDASSETFVPVLNNPVYSSSITLETEEFVAGADPVKFWLMLPPQNLSGHDLTLVVTSSGGNTTVEASMSGKEIVRNKPAVFNFGDASCDYKPDYLCVAAESAGVSVQFKLESESNAWASSSTVFDLEYSMDGENWNTCFFNRNYTLANVGDKIYFRGDNDSFSVVPDQYVHFVTTGPVAVSGNIMTLLDKSGLSETIPGEYTFVSLFKNAAITSAPSLPATTLAYGCYYYMFYGCTLLEKAPALPATTLAEYCYSSMFSGCTALTEAPVLPAAVMEEGCYADMFVGCSSLEKSPALPAMTLAQQCYSGMFGGCTSLKEAPALPATTLAASCYMAMFAHCTSLTTAPVLPAMTLADLCYLSMFLECSSLSRIEVAFSEWVGHILPTSIWCASVPQGGTFVCPSDLDIKFGDDFIPEGWSVQHSDESTTTPDYLSFTAEMPNSTVGMEVHGDNWTLPALQYSTDMKSWKAFNIGSTTITLPHIGDKVYFRGDNSSFSVSTSASVRFVMTGKIAASGNIMTLVDKSGRSRTIPNNYAFISLFAGCSSLTKAPSLPATSLKNYSYYCMFENCTSLTAAPELPATELADGCYAAMFNGCTSLTEAPELPATTLKRNCYSLLFQNCSSLRKVKVSFTDWNESVTSTKGWLHNVAPSGEFIAPDALPAIYDADHIPSSWAPDYLCFTASRANVTIGMEVHGDNWTVPSLEFSRDLNNWQQFVPGTTTVALQNVDDKVYFRGDNSTFSVGGSKYVRFTMSNGDSLYEASVAVSGNIMSLVDKTCTSTTIPNSYAFQYLFDHCILMTSAPSLPATTLTEGCYYSMFGDCDGLSSAPALPATTLAKSCYNAMFMNCFGLSSAPSLPATTMEERSYYAMFYGCDNLASAPTLPATTLAEYCYSEMFFACSSLTAAPTLPAARFVEGCYDSMFLNCTALESAGINATGRLPKNCCAYMFYGCSSLNRLGVVFERWDPTEGMDNATYKWVDGVSSTGTFVCPIDLPTSVRDENHIPLNWSIVHPRIEL